MSRSFCSQSDDEDVPIVIEAPITVVPEVPTPQRSGVLPRTEHTERQIRHRNGPRARVQPYNISSQGSRATNLRRNANEGGATQLRIIGNGEAVDDSSIAAPSAHVDTSTRASVAAEPSVICPISVLQSADEELLSQRNSNDEIEMLRSLQITKEYLISRENASGGGVDSSNSQTIEMLEEMFQAMKNPTIENLNLTNHHGEEARFREFANQIINNRPQDLPAFRMALHHLVNISCAELDAIMDAMDAMDAIHAATRNTEEINEGVQEITDRLQTQGLSDDNNQEQAQNGQNKMKCRVCNGILMTRSPTALPCGHMFCGDCADRVREGTLRCPTCGLSLSRHDFLRLLPTTTVDGRASSK